MKTRRVLQAILCLVVANTIHIQTSAAKDFILQSIYNQNEFVWAGGNEKSTNVIFIPSHCLDCMRQFLIFSNELRKKYNTDFNFKAVLSAPVWRRASRMLDSSKISKSSKKSFYYDPGQRLATFVGLDVKKKHDPYIVIMKGSKVLAVADFDLKSVASINRFVDMIK